MTLVPAVQREADWLRSHGDNLPALLTANGGPWDVVQAYATRTAQTRKTCLFVVRTTLTDVRWANQRRIQSTDLRVKARWPIGATTIGNGIWEDEQAAFDAAIDLVLARIHGHVFDHTHGGRFLSVAEAPDPGRITVRFSDPEQTAGASPAVLLADITYACDDPDFAA